MNNNYDDMQILYTKDLMDLLNIGRDKAYSLMKLKGFPSMKIGKSYIVTKSNLLLWLKNNAGRSINL